MSIISADTLKDLVGLHSTGPAGYNVHYGVNKDAEINADQNTVELELNQESLTAAKARNEATNPNGPITPERKPQIGSAVATIEKRNDTVAQQYRMPLTKSMTHAGPAPQMRHHPDYRTLFANTMAAGNPQAIKQRHMLRLRRTFDEIAHVRKIKININPENLPQTERLKMVQEAIQKGAKMTPLGALSQAVKKVAGYNPAEWARWQHADLLGVFTAPQMKK